MRIDYSEPRQSYTTTGATRQRTNSGTSGAKLVALVVASGLLFGSGFGTGWYFSQQSAKKAFRAAMEQQSLETASKGSAPTVPPTPHATPPQGAATPQGTIAQNPQQPQAGTAPVGQQPTAPATGPNGQPLSFFENLPKGQKNTVLGSGINEKPKPVTPQPAPAAAVQTDAQPAAAAKKPDAKKNDLPSAPSKIAPLPSGYLVQVASYSNRKDADSLKGKLVAKGYAAVVAETTIGDKTWYRVRIGRHLDKESATQISNQLMMGAKVIPDQDER